MNDYKLYIFDWDGTLMDSVERIISSMQTAAVLANVTKPSTEDTKKIIGLSLDKGIKQLFPQVTAEQAEQIVLHYRVEVKKTISPMFPNAINMLTQLKAQGKLLAVATGKSRVELERVWQASNTKHFFHSSRTATDAESKPAPDMLEQLLAEFDIPATQAIMIGDSYLDLDMAKNAGIDRIGVTMGAMPKSTLEKSEPLAIVDSIEQLADLIV